MSSKALVVVEGERREKDLLSCMRDAFSLNLEIVPYCGNISMLYDTMNSLDFSGDIVTILRNAISETDPKKDEKERILSDTYSDIILIFDLDPQHSIKQLDGETQDEALRRNTERVFRKAEAMAKVMDDSTDPTKGQIYINYPAVESYRDADDFFDDGYARKDIPLRDLCKEFGGAGYKAIAARAKLANLKRLSSYTNEDFSSLAAMNVYKLSQIMIGVWDVLSYESFRSYSSQMTILNEQLNYAKNAMSLWILNTSLYFVFDYKGSEFFQSVMDRCSGE